MRRFLAVSAVFCTAIILGFGAVVFFPPAADATSCDKQDRRTGYTCDDPVCESSYPYVHGMYDCGTEYPGGTPTCDCYFVACVLRCPLPM
jgi:hypothetical protein